MKLHLVLAVILCVLFPALALAYPTGLNVIPTADVLEPKSFRIEFENDGCSRLFSAESERYWLLQAGIAPGLEVGVDAYYLEETSTMLNAKYAVLEESDSAPALAFGAFDIGEGGSPTYYLAAAKSFGRHRFHAGAIGNRRHSDPMAGYEFELDDSAWLLFDWIRGDENYLTAGVYVENKLGGGISLAFGFPNSGEGENMVLLNLSWTCSLR